MSRRIPNERTKVLGAFYTPKNVTEIIANWAIENKNDTILEPSFGGGNFVDSGLRRLKELGCKNPEDHIFGYDIDKEAFNALNHLNINKSNFKETDFLETRDYEAYQHDVIIGNPPFIPIHKLDSKYKTNLYGSKQLNNYKIPKRSSLWVYFIHHSLRYLKDGGKMAWIVPDSICYADYGKKLINYLKKHFHTIKIIRITERYFAKSGTLEKTSILLCRGYKFANKLSTIVNFETLECALKYIVDKNKEFTIENKADTINLKKDIQLTTLGEIVNIKIGIVIGATKLLTLNKEQADKSQYHPKYTYPIITKGSQLKQITINANTLIKTANKTPIYLINGEKMKEEDVNLYSKLLATIPQEVLCNKTFANRKKVFGYDDQNHPDGFLTFFSQGLPSVIINDNLELNCTNSVHRLYLKPPYDLITLKFISIQLFACYFENQIKGLARQYGNNINKFEPSDAAKIAVIIKTKNNKTFVENIEKCTNKITNLINIYRYEEAKKIALNFIQGLVEVRP